MTKILALITIMVWPLIPLFWIPVHLRTGFFKRLGLMTYAMPLITWLPVAWVIYSHRNFLLQPKTEMHLLLRIAGIALLICGTSLHAWTARLLGIWGIIGVPEISAAIREDIISEGPFSIVRHPTYLAHTLMFSGVFLITGSVVVGIVAVLDFVLVNAAIIPLEERELFKRFGGEYAAYKKKVPARFFPGIPC